MITARVIGVIALTRVMRMLQTCRIRPLGASLTIRRHGMLAMVERTIMLRLRQQDTFGMSNLLVAPFIIGMRAKADIFSTT